jgi:hypothetical protein
MKGQRLARLRERGEGGDDFDCDHHAHSPIRPSTKALAPTEAQANGRSLRAD